MSIAGTDVGGLTTNAAFTIAVNDINEGVTAYVFWNSYPVPEDNSLGGNLINDNTGDGVDYGFGAAKWAIQDSNYHENLGEYAIPVGS